MTTEPHLIPTITDRGFTDMPPIEGTYPETLIRAYESSAAQRAHIWIAAENTEFRAVAVHLTIDDALRLADQIQYLASNHYQLRDAPTADPEPRVPCES